MGATNTKEARYSKRKGYNAEKKVEQWLKMIFPRLRRTGSVNYRDSAPDLEQDGTDKLRPIRIVATVQDRREPIISLRVSDLTFLFQLPASKQLSRVVVQVKARKKTWIETLMRELEEATNAR